MAVSYLNQNTESVYFGLSTDEKPLEVQNGALFHEMDTSQDFRFNEEKQEWQPQESNRWWITEW